MTIAYVFASRSRPEKFFECLHNIRDHSASSDYFVWAKLDEDDETMNNDAVKELLKAFPEVTVKWGNSTGKIHAINRDLDGMPHFDIIACQSDDMVFHYYGFDKVFREHCGPDDYLHLPDGYANEKLSTYTIMGRDYFNRFGYIYHPDYESVYADNEQFEVAKKLGRHKFVNIRVLTHAHAIWGHGVPDELLKKTENPVVYQRDHQIYLRRKANNFDL